MPGIGTAANAAAIAIGALVGVFCKKGLPENWQQTMMNALGLCIVVIGIQMALKTANIIIVICALVIGAIIGEILDIEGGFNRAGELLGAKLAKGDAGAAAQIAQGFMSASILFCSGAMGIVGSIQDGLSGDPTTLFAKATLDGIIALVFSANMGIGVMFSAISTGLYQGAITAAAGLVGPYVTAPILGEITSSGGVMIIAIGTNMLNLTKVRVGNLIPGIFVAALLAKFFI